MEIFLALLITSVFAIILHKSMEPQIVDMRLNFNSSHKEEHMDKRLHTQNFFGMGFKVEKLKGAIAQIKQNQPQDNLLYFQELDESLELYKAALRSTIDLMRPIDAYEFIKNDYIMRSETSLESNGLSDLKKYYHLNNLKIAYTIMMQLEIKI